MWDVFSSPPHPDTTGRNITYINPTEVHFLSRKKYFGDNNPT